MAEQLTERQARRSFLALAAAAALSLALAGCQMVPKGKPAPAPTRGGTHARPGNGPADRRQPQPRRRAGAADRPQCRGRQVDRQRRQPRVARHRRRSRPDQRLRYRRGRTAAAAQRAAGRRQSPVPGAAPRRDVRAIAPIPKRAGVPIISFSNDVSVAGDGVYLMGFTPGAVDQPRRRLCRARGAPRFRRLSSRRGLWPPRRAGAASTRWRKRRPDGRDAGPMTAARRRCARR